MKTYYKPLLISIFSFFLMYSCVSFNPGWNSTVKKQGSEDLKALIQSAQKLELSASSSDDISALIDIYLEIEKVDPDNYYALWKIGNYHILLGAAHSTKIKTKKTHYKEAIKYCEKAMYTNVEFAKAINEGNDIADASAKLTIQEVDAMGYWYTARFYYFKECLKPLGRIFNTSIVIDNNKVINHIDKLDPNWAGGGNYFSRALYYIATPEKFGGSKEKAAEEFSLAINVGPNYLVNRWGRAKYLYKLTGNSEGFKSDMEWVVEQDPHKGGNTLAWNVYFQNDAKKELASLQ